MRDEQIKQLVDITVDCWAKCNKIINRFEKKLDQIEFKSEKERNDFNRGIHSYVGIIFFKIEELFDQYRKVLKSRD